MFNQNGELTLWDLQIKNAAQAANRSADQETAIGIDACSYRFCKK